MRPLPLSFSSSSRLQELKQEIKSVLIAESNREVTVDQLAYLYKDLICDDIPYKDFNHPSLEEFLWSIPDTVHLDKNEKDEWCVTHVESEKTRHLTSLISRQVKSKSSNNNKKYHRRRLQSNSIKPDLLAKIMLKLACSSPTCSFKKVDLLSEIKSAIGVYSTYTVDDLNSQLHELNHILKHDDVDVSMKHGGKLCRVENFIRESTKERLRKLAAKYSAQGIWCAQLPKVYQQEYGIDLEYKELGFNSINEFLGVLDIFKFVKPYGSNKYKVFDCSSSTTSPSASKLLEENDNVYQQESVMNDALPMQQLSAEVTKRFIPQEFMNPGDSIGSMKNILKYFSNDNSANVIVSEICNPSLFWIILDKSRRRLVRLMDSLQDFYTRKEDMDEYRVSRIVAKPGLHIACIYANLWHRGVIQKVDQNSFDLTIHFYDYGTTKVYKGEQVYFLHKQFSTLPAQATACSLHNIQPADVTENGKLKWSKKAINKFTDKAIEKEFVARVFSIDEESLKVDLVFDTRSNKAVHMTEWMIKKKLANWGSNEEKVDSVKKHRKECCNKVFDKKFQDLEHVDHASKLEALQKYKTRFNSIQVVATTVEHAKTKSQFQDVDSKAIIHNDAISEEQQKTKSQFQDVNSKARIHGDMVNDEQQKTECKVQNVDTKAIMHEDMNNDEQQKTESQFQYVNFKTRIHGDAINDEQQKTESKFQDADSKARIHENVINDQQQKTEIQFRDADSKPMIYHNTINEEKQQQQNKIIVNDRQTNSRKTVGKNLQKRSIDQALRELQRLVSRTKM